MEHKLSNFRLFLLKTPIFSPDFDRNVPLPGHLRGRRLRVVPDPVVGVVDLDEGGDELGLGLPDVAAPPLLRPEHRVVVQRVVDYGVTCAAKLCKL